MARPQPNPEVLLQHAGFVRALARELVFDAALARDVEQDTWLRALRYAPRDLRSARGWLAAIVRSVASRANRRAAARRETRPDDSEPAREHGLPSPDELVEQEQARRELVAAVLRLEEPLRGTLVLHYLDGLSLRQVARRTEVPLETARSRVKRGLARLREELRRKDARTWSLALVQTLALDPPRLARGLALFARDLLPIASTMTTTHKLALGSAALLVCLATGWLVVETSTRREPASSSVAARAELALEPIVDGPSPAEARDAGERADRQGAVEARPTTAPPTELVAHGRLRVRVVWAKDESPAAGVELRVDRADAGVERQVRRATTDAAGRAELADVLPGRWSVRPFFDGFAVVEVVAGGTHDVEVAIPQGIAVHGSVVDADGAPVPDAEVLLSSGVLDPAYELATVARSGRDGRFELRSAPARIGACLSARARGRSPTRQSVLTGAPASRAEVELVFEAAGTPLAVVVLGPEGRPVEGAEVLVGSEREIAFLSRPDGTAALAPIGELARTDASGRVALAGVALGELPVRVRSAGRAPWLGSVDTRSTDTLEVRLEPAASLAGRVVDERGAPVPEAKVALEGEYGFLARSTRSAADGAFVLHDLASGRLVVRAEAEGRGAETKTFEALPGSALAWSPVLRSGAELRGRVELAGAELRGWFVRGTGRADADGAAGAPPREFFQTARTDAEGRFVLHDCPDELEVVLFHRAGPFPVARARGVRPGPEEIVLRPDPELLPTARVEGRLVDERGEAVRNADVSVVSERLGRTLVHPDPLTGRFEIGGLPKGDWWLEADAHVAGWAAHRSVPFALVADATRDMGDVVLGRGGSMSVRLRRNASCNGKASHAVVTDEAQRVVQFLELHDDAARSRPLPPGRYRVTLLGLRDAAANAATATVVPGEETDVELELAPGLPVVLRLRVPGLDPGTHAEVRVWTDRDELLWRAEILGPAESPVLLTCWLLPGRYHVTADAAGLATMRRELALEPGPSTEGDAAAPRTIDLSLPPR